MNAETTDPISSFGRFDIVYRLKDHEGRVLVTHEPPLRVPELSLRLFESALGTSLPIDYRKFITFYSDAYVSGAVVRGMFAPGVFYGLRDNSSVSVLGKWAESRIFLPTFTIPIADDVANGGTICVELAGPRRGFISSRFGNETSEDVAESFTEFLRLIDIDMR